MVVTIENNYYVLQFTRLAVAQPVSKGSLSPDTPLPSPWSSRLIIPLLVPDLFFD